MTTKFPILLGYLLFFFLSSFSQNPVSSFDGDKPLTTFRIQYSANFSTPWDGTKFYNQWDALEPNAFNAADAALGYLQFSWVQKRIICTKLDCPSPYILETEIDYTGGSNRGGVVLRVAGSIDGAQEPPFGDPGFNRKGIALYPTEDGSSMIVQFSGAIPASGATLQTIIQVPKPAGMVTTLKERNILSVEDFGTSIYVYLNTAPFIRIDLGGLNLNKYTTGTVFDADMKVAGTFAGMDIETKGKLAVAQRDASLKLFSISFSDTKLAQQVITFEPVGVKETTDAPFTVNASASSGLPIVYSRVSGPATMNGNMVTLTGLPGLIIVKAYQAGNDTCFPKSATQSFFVQNSTAKNAIFKASLAYIKSAPFNINGIPFLKDTIWKEGKEGGVVRLDSLNIQAKSLYLFGCVNSVDAPHFNWGGVDDFKNQFIGDRGGYFRIKYKSGITDDIPLVFGYTLWWRAGYDASPEPFKSDPAKHAILDGALCIANGIQSGTLPYFLRISLRDEPVLEITLKDDSTHVGHPVIDGITFEDIALGQQLDVMRFIKIDGGLMPENMTSWLAKHSIASSDAMPVSRESALRDLSQVIYTFPEDVNTLTVEQTGMDEINPGLSVPVVKFTGPAEADILSNVFLENSVGLLGRIDDRTGMVHESAAKSANYMGWVGYTPDLQAYYNDAFTRNHFIPLLANMGFLPKAEKGMDFFHQWIMYFPNSYPTLQMGGKPVPGHATVIANKPHVYFDELVKVGWPTKFTTRDYGNPETDGHGMQMLSTWRTWAKSGKTKEWIDQRWDVINEAAEWIPWCLDNPELSFSEHGLLYAESEGGMLVESLYCNTPCYYGLLSYAEMADVAGKASAAQRWRAQAERLRLAMEAYFPINLAPWGDVWDPKKAGGWGLPVTTVPVVEAMQLYGYDAINHLPEGWAERTRNTYSLQSSKRNPRYCDPSALGYGQGFMTESALLLDQMDDATQMTEWMARFCYAPRQPHPYRVPESAIMKSDGSMWARGGDLGNGFQMGEVILSCQILLGIDDYGTKSLKLMPRVPVGWTGFNVQNWPVRVLSSDKSEMAMLSVKLKRGIDGHTFDLKLSVDKPVDSLAVRVGPFPLATKQLKVKIDNTDIDAMLFESGDSKWAWVTKKNIQDSCHVMVQTDLIDGISAVGVANFSVYPNPSSGRFTINCDHRKVDSIKVINLQGSVVYFKEVKFSGTKTMNLKLAKGVYILKLTGDAPFAAQQLVIE